MSDDEKPVALLVLDIDGTVRKGFDEIGRFINGPEDVEVFPEAVTMMQEWKAAGGRIIGASNQGGIALGHTTIAQVGAAMDKTFQDSGSLFDFISICQHHPQAKDPEMARCWCRKPAPGMVIEAALTMGWRYDERYPPHLALFVGDRPEDEQCAKILAMDFMWAKDWRALAAGVRTNRA